MVVDESGVRHVASGYEGRRDGAPNRPSSSTTAQHKVRCSSSSTTCETVRHSPVIRCWLYPAKRAPTAGPCAPSSYSTRCSSGQAGRQGDVGHQVPHPRRRRFHVYVTAHTRRLGVPHGRSSRSSGPGRWRRRGGEWALRAVPGRRGTAVEDTGLGHRSDVDVRFGTERIGAYRLFPSRDPAQCDADRSAPNPSPTGSTASDICHP